MPAVGPNIIGPSSKLCTDYFPASAINASRARSEAVFCGQSLVVFLDTTKLSTLRVRDALRLHYLTREDSGRGLLRG